MYLKTKNHIVLGPYAVLVAFVLILASCSGADSRRPAQTQAPAPAHTQGTPTAGPSAKTDPASQPVAGLRLNRASPLWLVLDGHLQAGVSHVKGASFVHYRPCLQSRKQKTTPASLEESSPRKVGLKPPRPFKVIARRVDGERFSSDVLSFSPLPSHWGQVALLGAWPGDLWLRRSSDAFHGEHENRYWRWRGDRWRQIPMEQRPPGEASTSEHVAGPGRMLLPWAGGAKLVPLQPRTGLGQRRWPPRFLVVDGKRKPPGFSKQRPLFSDDFDDYHIYRYAALPGGGVLVLDIPVDRKMRQLAVRVGRAGPSGKVTTDVLLRPPHSGEVSLEIGLHASSPKEVYVAGQRSKAGKTRPWIMRFDGQRWQDISIPVSGRLVTFSPGPSAQWAIVNEPSSSADDEEAGRLWRRTDRWRRSSLTADVTHLSGVREGAIWAAGHQTLWRAAGIDTWKQVPFLEGKDDWLVTDLSVAASGDAWISVMTGDENQQLYRSRKTSPVLRCRR